MIDSILSPTGWPARGVRVTPPARLVRLHRRNLTNVLVMGGTADQRIQVAYAFHREGPVRRGPFVCVDGEQDEQRLRLSLQSLMSSIEPDLQTDTMRSAEHGTFFVDAVGSLSKDTQRILLACLLSCVNVPLEDHDKPWSGRLIAGNSEHLSFAVADGRFSPALFDSLDKVRVELPHVNQVHVA